MLLEGSGDKEVLNAEEASVQVIDGCNGDD